MVDIKLGNGWYQIGKWLISNCEIATNQSDGWYQIGKWLISNCEIATNQSDGWYVCGADGEDAGVAAGLDAEIPVISMISMISMITSMVTKLWRQWHWLNVKRRKVLVCKIWVFIEQYSMFVKVFLQVSGVLIWKDQACIFVFLIFVFSMYLKWPSLIVGSEQTKRARVE